MNRTQRSLRFAAYGAIATLGLATASTFAQMGDPTPNDAGPQPGMNDRGAGMGGPGGGGRGGMRGGGGPAAIVVSETFGATVRPLPRNHPVDDVKPGVGLSVESVKPESLAAKGGLKEGDLIVKLGDQWVINPAQLGVLLSIQDVDCSVKLTVKRGSENVELEYKFDPSAHDAMTKAIDAAGPGSGGMRGGPGGGGPGGGGGGRGGPDGGDRPTPPDAGGMNP